MINRVGRPRTVGPKPNPLGLSLVRSAAQAHHGAVTLVSEPGRGSTFTLHLPASDRQPADTLPSGEIPVDVCMVESAQELRISETQAKSLVAVIFSGIAVHLSWHAALSDCDNIPGKSGPAAFEIRWAEYAPYTLSAGSLASARPFASSGTSITLYEVPLQHFLWRYANAPPEVVLAYVLAHELAHVMKGLDHHSASGILKASWSYQEYYRMLSHTLTFTAKDVDLIRAGLEAKRSNIASGGGVPQSEHVVQQPKLASARPGSQE